MTLRVIPDFPSGTQVHMGNVSHDMAHAIFVRLHSCCPDCIIWMSVMHYSVE
jgi:hypothetical protein